MSLVYSKEGLYLVSTNSLLFITIDNVIQVCECNATILRTHVSPSGDVVVMTADKHLLCYRQISTGTFEKCGDEICPKRPVSMDSYPFSADKCAIIYADKVGEIWAADLPSLRRKVFLGGHTASVITDVAVSPCSTLVATSDRDEKIKLSQLPSFNIDRYCLGHTNVVTSICFVPGNGHFLCSVGWDFTLCLWDYVTGQLLDNVQFDSSSNRKPSMIVEASIVTDGGLEEEDAAEEERVYDEREAGNFPMKVVVCITSSNSVVAVVMFKGDPVLQLIAIGESLSAPSPLPLTNAPADIVAMSTGELMVLLPKPHYVEVYDLSVTAGAICSLKMVNMIATQANIFCSKEGLEFSQMVVFNEVDGDGAVVDNSAGMRKHALDMPFDNTTNKNNRKQKKNKREEVV